MSVNVVIIGAGGFGREALDVIEAHNDTFEKEDSVGSNFRVIGIADDLPSHQNLERLAKRGYRYLGTTDEVIEELEPCGFVLGIGNPRIKENLDTKLTDAGWRACSVVHPSAVIGSECLLDEGAVICSGSQISTNTRLGRHVHVNPNATIGHDAVLGDFVSVNPGAVLSGEVTVERGSLVGAASVILQGLQVGSLCVIGASACVVKDVSENSIMVGVPARELRSTATAHQRENVVSSKRF